MCIRDRLTHVKHARSLVSRVWELEKEPSIAFSVDPLKKRVNEKPNSRRSQK